jgi:hypothetical protein
VIRQKATPLKTGIYSSGEETFEVEGPDKKIWFGLLFWLLTLLSLCLVFYGIARVFFNGSYLLLVLFVINFCLWFAFYLRFQFLSTNVEYLRNIQMHEGAPQYIDHLRENRPRILMKIRCFHYTMETESSHQQLHHQRLQEEPDLEGGIGGDAVSAAPPVHTPREVMTEGNFRKVYTYQEEREFKFDTWEDHSPPLIGMEHYDIVKLKVKSMIGFSDLYTKEKFEEEQARFIDEHKGKDVMYQYSCIYEVPGLRPKVLSIVHMDQKPALLSIEWFFASTFMLLGWPYSFWLDRQSTKVNFLLKKVVHREPTAEELIRRSSSKSIRRVPTNSSVRSSSSKIERRTTDNRVERRLTDTRVERRNTGQVGWDGFSAQAPQF